jgi:two-component system, NarL family, nitrate/nitrite response regulator NarL
MTNNGCIRILIVDDHAAIRRGLRHLLAACADMAVVGEAAEATDALVAAVSLSPDVVLLDVHLAGASGFEIAPQLRQVIPAARILMLASLEDEVQLALARIASVDGYVQKCDADEKLAAAIRAVWRGEHWPAERLRIAEV